LRNKLEFYRFHLDKILDYRYKSVKEIQMRLIDMRCNVPTLVTLKNMLNLLVRDKVLEMKTDYVDGRVIYYYRRVK